MMMSVEMIPFFERFGECDEGWPGECYVAGFRKADGSPAGVEVVVPADMVQRAVLAKSGLSLSLNLDGTFVLHAEELSNDTLDEASRSHLAGQSLEALLKECLEVDSLSTEGNPAGELHELRKQLAKGLNLVDEALRQLSEK